jgi:hypothetical protein
MLVPLSQAQSRRTNFHHSLEIEKDRTATKLAMIQGKFFMYIRKTYNKLFWGQPCSAYTIEAGVYLLADCGDLEWFKGAL